MYLAKRCIYFTDTKTDLGLLIECLKFQMKYPESQKQALLSIYSICQNRGLIGIHFNVENFLVGMPSPNRYYICFSEELIMCTVLYNHRRFKSDVLCIYSTEDHVDLFREMGGVTFLCSLSKSSIVHPDVKETALFTLGTLAEANGGW